MNPKGRICALDPMRYRLLMENNDTTQALYCVNKAQITEEMHTKGQQRLVDAELLAF